MHPASRLGELARPLLWAGAAIALSRFGRAVDVLPVLGVLRGPLGPVLAVLALAIGVVRALPKRDLRAPRPALLFAGSFLVLSAIGLHYAHGLRVSGDEPHYLLMAQSLWREGDLDIEDNLRRGDFSEYIDELRDRHYAAPRRDGRPFPAHSPGLPALLAVPYALGGRTACILVLAILAAGTGLQVRALAERLFPGQGALAWAAALGPPLAFYAFHVYTEVPSAFCVATALRLILAAEVSPLAATVAALATAALPWLHVKMTITAAALGLVALQRLRGRALGAFVGVAGLAAGAFLGFYWWIYGSPTPLAVYGGVPRDADGAPALAIFGLFLDRSFGLLEVAPVFALALPGVLLLAPRREAWPLLLVGASVLAPILPWRMWWGGQCPPARFVVPLVPVLAVAVAARLVIWPRGLSHWRWALTAIGVAVLLLGTARPESMLLLNRRDRPTRLLDAVSPEGGTQLARYLPSLVFAAPAEGRVLGIWLVALLALFVLDAAAQKRAGVDRLFEGLGLPLALLAAIGALVDAWARAGP